MTEWKLVPVPNFSIITDLGNVLAWFDRSIAYRALGRHVGLSPLFIAETLDDAPLRGQFEAGELDERTFFARVTALLGCEGKIDFPAFAALWSDMFSVNAELVATLRAVKHRVTLVLLSNTNSLHFGFIEKRFPEIVELFDGRLALSYRVGAAKPDMRIYLEALRLAAMPAEKCLYVDDLPEYVAVAESMGIQGHVYSDHAAFERFLKNRV